MSTLLFCSCVTSTQFFTEIVRIVSKYKEEIAQETGQLEEKDDINQNLKLRYEQSIVNIWKLEASTTFYRHMIKLDISDIHFFVKIAQIVNDLGMKEQQVISM